MIGNLAVGDPDHRPPLMRSRSHTIPSDASPMEPLIEPQTIGRPKHGRSSSYLSPVSKSPNTNTVPSEKTSRLHIPGTGHRGETHSYRHPLRHRHTQSQAESYLRQPRAAESKEDLPHVLAGLSAERLRRQNLERYGTSTSNHLTHVGTGRSHRSGNLSLDATYANYPADFSGRPDLRRRATSDPRHPRAPQKTPIEVALDLKDARKIANRAALTTKDIERAKREQEEAEDELRKLLADVGKTSTDITRRLDYTFYALLEKVGNLVATISSFQNLSTQSRHLIDNFTSETGKLDKDIRRRTEAFQKSFNDREAKVADLQERSRRAGAKAQDLNQRLENARIFVGNWEKRENAKARKRGRMWVMVFWMWVTVFMMIVTTLVAKEWWFRGDPVRWGLHLPPGGSRNKSLSLDREQLRRLEVPEEVREVLEGIEQRRASKAIWKGPVWPALPRLEELSQGKEDERLRRLDEL